MYKLDPRVNKDKIRHCLNIEGENLVGKTGYFTNFIKHLSDLSLCKHGTIERLDFTMPAGNIFGAELDRDTDRYGFFEYFICDEDLNPGLKN